MTGPSLSVYAPGLRVRRGLVQASVGHMGKTETRVKSHFSNSLSAVRVPVSDKYPGQEKESDQNRVLITKILASGERRQRLADSAGSGLVRGDTSIPGHLRSPW